MSQLPKYVSEFLDRLTNLKEEKGGWVASCPCPTHGSDGEDHHASLRVTIGDNGNLLVACRVACPTEKVLDALGASWGSLYCPQGQTSCQALASPQGPPGASNDVALLHRAYSLVLEELTLGMVDAEFLEERGLPAEAARSLGYRTLTTLATKYLPKKLYKTLGEKLYDVPGFYQNQHAQPAICPGLDGIVHPVRNVDGLLVALKSRKDSGNNKYLYWSSTKRGGAGPGAPVHVPLGVQELCDVLRVTEGERKADVAYRLTGLPTVACPGLNWEHALPTIFTLNPDRVLVSFDLVDVLGRAEVCGKVMGFLEELQKCGYDHGVEVWSDHSKHKGVDDALVAGQALSTKWGPQALSYLADAYDKLTRPQGDAPEAPPPFPLHVFPDKVREFCEQVSRQLDGCPPDFAACGCLAAVSRAYGTTRLVQMEPGWRVRGNHWIAVVAPASSGKSPSVDAALAPLQRRQEEASNAYDSQKRAHNRYLAEAKEAKAEKRALPEKVLAPTPLTSILTGDVTVEAVSYFLNQNRQVGKHDASLLIDTDELIGFVNGMGAYKGGKGSDKEFWLKAAMGKQLTTHRKTNGEITIIGLHSISLIGGIVPDYLSQLRSDKDKEDGFVPRFLFSMPVCDDGIVIGSDDPFDPVLAEKWASLLYRLLDGCKFNPDGKPELLLPTPVAKHLYREWALALKEETKSPDFDPRLRAPWGKLPKHCCSLVLTLRMLRASAEAADNGGMVGLGVESEDVAGAVELVSYFKAHYRAALDVMPEGPRDRRLKDFVRWVRVHKRGSVAVRDVYRNKRWECAGARDALSLCRLAVDRGHGILRKEKGARGRGKWVFVLGGDV